ncbi:MAG: radical SAM protein [Candidatus Omnitrophota bacterium]
MIYGIRAGITNYCNLGCDYCFFKEWLTLDKSEQAEMKLSEMRQLLDYCKADGVREIMLHGGEPMLHSGIEQIFGLIRKNKISISLQTNGIFDQALVDLLAKNDVSGCLVNYNHPDSLKKATDKKLLDSNIKGMLLAGIDLTLGYNIFESAPDYEFFIHAVKRFKIKKVRFDLAKPSWDFKNKYIHLKELFKSAPMVAKFIKACLNAGAIPQMDCVWPVCFINRPEFDFMRKETFILPSVCRTTLDIVPGLIISTCLCPAPGERFKLAEFGSLSQAYAFFAQAEDRFRWEYQAKEECKNCLFWINRACEGACLKYKRLLHRDTFFRSDLRQFLAGKSNPAQDVLGKPGLFINTKNNFMLFKLAAALEQQEREDDAFKVFSMLKDNGLRPSERRYKDDFLNRHLNKMRRKN